MAKRIPKTKRKPTANKPSKQQSKATNTANIVNTVGEVARHFGVAERTAYAWKATGMPGPPYDLDSIVEWRKARRQEATPDQASANARRSEALAKLAEVKLEKIRGELVSVADVRRLFVRHITESGTIIDQLPDRVASLLPSELPSKKAWDELRKQFRDHARRITDSARTVLADMLTEEAKEFAECSVQ